MIIDSPFSKKNETFIKASNIDVLDKLTIV